MVDLIILTEAGGSVGYGHLMRCLAIAKDTDKKTELYVDASGDYPKNKYSKDFSWRTNLEKLFEFSTSLSILVDSYLADRKIYQLLSNHFDHVSVLDDYNRLEYPVDLIINPGIKLPDYKNQTAKVAGGSKYIILRNEVIQHKQKSNYQRYQNLLVTFGGSDSSNIYNWLLPLLDKHLFNSIIVITGNNNNVASLSKKFKSSLITWYGQVDAKVIAELMYHTDMCISAGGQTLHELAYIGVPTICIKTGEDQELNIEGYVEAGFLLEKLSLSSNDLPHRINNLLNDYQNIELRQSTSEKGKVIVEGYGGKYIINRIFQLSV